MSAPYFSIIIPCLDEEKTLPRLLKDLRSQSYKDFDVWIVDGKSEDRTSEIVKKVIAKDPRFHLVVSKVRNVGYQRNLGAEKSKGSYVLFFDADNRLPNFYLAGLHYHCAKEQLTSFTSFAQSDTSNATEGIFINLTNMVIENGAKIGLPFTMGACIGCQRDTFNSVNGFDESMTFGEDVNLVRRIVRAGYTFTVLKEPLYSYSMRRYRKEGTLKFARKYAPLGIKLLLNKKSTEPLENYPMLGGTYFDEDLGKERKIQTMRQFQALMRTLKEILSS